MTEQELSVKLAETEQRARSNMHRIEKLEVVTLIFVRTILLKLQFSQTTYIALHLDYIYIQ